MIERPQWNVFRFTNPSLVTGSSALGQEVTLDTDAPFRLTGVAVYVFSSTGAPLGAAPNVGLTLRWTMPDQTWVQKHLDSCQMLNPFDNQAVNGAGSQTAPYYSYFSPLKKNIFYPNASSIILDFSELPNVADKLVMVVFMGTKLYGEGSVWWPVRDPSKPARPFVGYSIQFDNTKLPLLNVPFAVNPDADFCWQFSAQTSNPGNTLSPVGAIRNVGIKIKDWTGKYFMNDFVPLDLIFGFDNQQTPGLVYPEIYIPKNQLLFFDLVGLP